MPADSERQHRRGAPQTRADGDVEQVVVLGLADGEDRRYRSTQQRLEMIVDRQPARAGGNRGVEAAVGFQTQLRGIVRVDHENGERGRIERGPTLHGDGLSDIGRGDGTVECR